MTSYLSDGHSQIAIHQKGLSHLASYIKELSISYTSVALISTPLVFQLYGNLVQDQLQTLTMPVLCIMIPQGEPFKTLESAHHCWEKMAEHGLDRQSLVIALGGGVISDIAGFVAACYMRGIDYLSIPTTLMGMIDASIGGKTGINLGTLKNFIGSFYPAKLVLIDPLVLKTLSKREFAAGLAEMIKYGIIRDYRLFEQLEQHIESFHPDNPSLLEPFIYRSCQIKCETVKEDPKDQGVRSHLNYGHTFAHAIEGLTAYQTYLHGEAVSIGMNCAMYLSYKMNKIDNESLMRQQALCLKAGLPIQLPKRLCLEQLVQTMKGDKKTIGGKINLILPQKIGKVSKFSNIDPTWIKKTLIKKDTDSLERT